MTADRIDPFDLLGELPTGTAVLEASAGTGKTYTIAALVVRYVAEGIASLDELLVITFGRMASQELRERVRSQLVVAQRALARPGSVGDDRFLEFLVGVGADELRLAASASPTRWPPSTRRRSRPPTSSASWCCVPSAWRGTPTPAPPSWRTSTSS